MQTAGAIRRMQATDRSRLTCKRGTSNHWAFASIILIKQRWHSLAANAASTPLSEQSTYYCVWTLHNVYCRNGTNKILYLSISKKIVLTHSLLQHLSYLFICAHRSDNEGTGGWGFSRALQHGRHPRKIDPSSLQGTSWSCHQYEVWWSQPQLRIWDSWFLRSLAREHQLSCYHAHNRSSDPDQPWIMNNHAEFTISKQKSNVTQWHIMCLEQHTSERLASNCYTTKRQSVCS